MYISLVTVGNCCQGNITEVLQTLCDISERKAPTISDDEVRAVSSANDRRWIIPQYEPTTLGLQDLCKRLTPPGPEMRCSCTNNECSRLLPLLAPSTGSRDSCATLPAHWINPWAELRSTKSWCAEAEEAEVSWRLELLWKELDGLQVFTLGSPLTFYRERDLWQLRLEFFAELCVEQSESMFLLMASLRSIMFIKIVVKVVVLGEVISVQCIGHKGDV